eukprot:g4601.t1
MCVVALYSADESVGTPTATTVGSARVELSNAPTCALVPGAIAYRPLHGGSLEGSALSEQQRWCLLEVIVPPGRDSNDIYVPERRGATSAVKARAQARLHSILVATGGRTATGASTAGRSSAGGSANARMPRQRWTPRTRGTSLVRGLAVHLAHREEQRARACAGDGAGAANPPVVVVASAGEIGVGLNAGDIIVAVNGLPVAGVPIAVARSAGAHVPAGQGEGASLPLAIGSGCISAAQLQDAERVPAKAKLSLELKDVVNVLAGSGIGVDGTLQTWAPFLALLASGGGGGGGGEGRDRVGLTMERLVAWDVAREAHFESMQRALDAHAPGSALAWARERERARRASRTAARVLWRRGWHRGQQQWGVANREGAAVAADAGGRGGGAGKAGMWLGRLATLFRWAAFVVGSRTVASADAAAGPRQCTLLPGVDLLNHRTGAPKPELRAEYIARVEPEQFDDGAEAARGGSRGPFELVAGTAVGGAMAAHAAPTAPVQIFDDYDGGSFAQTGLRKCAVDMLWQYGFLPLPPPARGCSGGGSAPAIVGGGAADAGGGRDCWFVEVFVEVPAPGGAMSAKARVAARFSIVGGRHAVRADSGTPPDALLRALRLSVATANELKDGPAAAAFGCGEMYECPAEAQKAYSQLRAVGASRRRAMRLMADAKDWFLRVQHATFDKERAFASVRVSDQSLAATNIHGGTALVALSETVTIGESLPFVVSMRVEANATEPVVGFGLVPLVAWPEEQPTFGLMAPPGQKFAAFASLNSDRSSCSSAAAELSEPGPRETWPVAPSGVTRVRLTVNPLLQRMKLEGNGQTAVLERLGFEPGAELLVVLQLSSGRLRPAARAQPPSLRQVVGEKAVAAGGKSKARMQSAAHRAARDAARERERKARAEAVGWEKRRAEAEAAAAEAAANAKRLFTKGWDKAARVQEKEQAQAEKRRDEADAEDKRLRGEAAVHKVAADGDERKLEAAEPWVQPLTAVQIESSLDHALLVPYAEMTAIGQTRRPSNTTGSLFATWASRSRTATKSPTAIAGMSRSCMLWK